jgi:hypothetical protein
MRVKTYLEFINAHLRHYPLLSPLDNRSKYRLAY